MSDPHSARPEPDALLTQAQKEGRGRLKIFLGAAPGVGKTYAMLRAAAERVKEGRDVVAGIIETHGRKETEALTHDLDILPRRQMEYRGKIFQEMDVDALLARKPEIALVDELAHTNIEGSRHAKRWQDVEELLDNGINVYSTLNIQHLESLNDIVERITTVKVQETLPDSVLNLADEIALIDIPPDELIDRLREGKVYVPEQAQMAIRNYFSRGNLTALREMAMRTAAERVDSDLIALMKTQGVATLWPARERIIVCVDESGNASDLVRTTSRIASRTKMPWIALHVESVADHLFTDKERDNIDESLRLAEQMGGESITIQGGTNIADDILSFARSRNATRLIIGRSGKAPLSDILFPSVSKQLIQKAGDFDVTLLHRTAQDKNEGSFMRHMQNFAGAFQIYDFIEPTVGVALAMIVSFILYHFLPGTSLSLIFLIPVLYAGVRHGLWPSLYTVFLGFAIYNFFFTEPRFTFHMYRYHDIATLILFVLVAVVTGNLAVKLKNQIEALRASARRTAQMHDFARKLASALTFEDILQETVVSIAIDLQCRAVILLPDEKDGSKLRLAAHYPEKPEELGGTDWAAAEWSWKNGRPAGAGSDTLPASQWYFVPLKGPKGVIALVGTAAQVINTRTEQADEFSLTSARRRSLLAYCDQAALAIEREQLSIDIEKSRLENETERLRTALLSSVSHDLRTPLSSIIGSATTLNHMKHSLSEKNRTELVNTILGEAERLNRFVQNLLDMTRLGHGAMEPKREWIGDIRDILGRATSRLQKVLNHHKVEFRIDDDVANLYADPSLIEQVMVNILENAAKYSPPETRIILSMEKSKDGRALLKITDQGYGIPEADREKIFDMFYRVRAGDSKVAGTGLGLAICRGIIESHGGTIHAEAGFMNKGTVIVISFPSQMARPKSFGHGDDAPPPEEQET